MQIYISSKNDDREKLEKINYFVFNKTVLIIN